MEHFIERENNRDNFNKLQIFKGKDIQKKLSFVLIEELWV
jgi:hypothetical protein